MSEPSSVVVVESPAKAKTINKYLGRDYRVLASYGHIRAGLEKAGTTIGNNDLLIAAHAMAIRARVATANIGEFQRVKGLKVLDWLT